MENSYGAFSVVSKVKRLLTAFGVGRAAVGQRTSFW